jgi:hypothetical protein
MNSRKILKYFILFFLLFLSLLSFSFRSILKVHAKPFFYEKF